MEKYFLENLGQREVVRHVKFPPFTSSSCRVGQVDHELCISCLHFEQSALHGMEVIFKEICFLKSSKIIALLAPTGVDPDGAKPNNIMRRHWVIDSIRDKEGQINYERNMEGEFDGSSASDEIIGKINPVRAKTTSQGEVIEFCLSKINYNFLTHIVDDLKVDSQNV